MFTSATNRILEQLSSLDYLDPPWDEEQVKASLSRQCELLDFKPPPFEAVPSIEAIKETYEAARTLNTLYYPLMHVAHERARRCLPTKLGGNSRLAHGRAEAALRMNQRRMIHNGLSVRASFDGSVMDLSVMREGVMIPHGVPRTVAILETRCKAPLVTHWFEICSRQLEAVLHGLGYYLVTQRAFYIIPVPRMVTDERGNLHSTAGKAAEWKNGDGFYFLQGHEFTEDEHWRLVNDEFRVGHLREISNTDKRSIALSMMGAETVIKELGAQLVDTGEKGTRLYLVDNPNMRRWMYPSYFMVMDDASTDRQFLEWVQDDIGRQLDAELCQAQAFGISLEQWLSVELEA